MLRQVARATSRDEVDEILAEKQRGFALVAQKFYDAQEKFLVKIEKEGHTNRKKNR